MSENIPEPANGACRGEIWSHVIRGIPGCREDLPAPLKTRILSFLTYPYRPGKRSESQLMLLADISGRSLPVFSRNGGRIDGILKTIVSFFYEFMSENLPERANETLTGEIWSHIFHALLLLKRGGDRLIPYRDYPGRIRPPSRFCRLFRCYSHRQPLRADLGYACVPDPEVPPVPVPGIAPEFPEDRAGTGKRPEPADRFPALGFHLHESPVQPLGIPDPDKHEKPAPVDYKVTHAVAIRQESHHRAPRSGYPNRIHHPFYRPASPCHATHPGLLLPEKSRGLSGTLHAGTGTQFLCRSSRYTAPVLTATP